MPASRPVQLAMATTTTTARRAGTEEETEEATTQLLSNGSPTTNGKAGGGVGGAVSRGQEIGTGADSGVGLTGHTPTSGTFMKLKTYLLALRPWSLSASLVPTLLGSALAYRSQWAAEFSLATFFLTAFTVVTVHCAGNVVNTYFDYIKGIDKQKADDRTLVDHILTKDEVSSRTESREKERSGINWLFG